MKTRVIGGEMLDCAPEDAAQANRRDLRRIHEWLGGDWILHSLVRRYFGRGDSFSALDVGAAWGDTSRRLTQAFPGARVTSVDIHAGRLRHAPPPKLRCDALSLPFRNSSFDLVICSLLLHHYSADDAAMILANMHRVARRAAIVVDLWRHPLAHGFLPATRWLFGWHPVTLHDGCVSVAAGFRRRELPAIARAARLENVEVRSHLPWFRMSMICPASAIVKPE